MSGDEIPVLPDHPGTVLRRRLAPLNQTTAAIARMLLLSRQSLHEILAGKQAITPGVALRIAKLTGTSPEMWLNLQQARDLAIARCRSRELLTQVPSLEERW